MRKFDHVLSVRQPHAQLLLTPNPRSDIPVKWCECRSWKPGKLNPSTIPEDKGLPRIYIHASSRPDSEEMSKVKDLKVLWDSLDRPDLQYSCILGSVRLLGVVVATEILDVELGTYKQVIDLDPTYNRYVELRKSVGLKTNWKLLDKFDAWSFPEHCEIYWWLVDRPILLDKPVSCKGKLNIWSHVV